MLDTERPLLGYPAYHLIDPDRVRVLQCAGRFRRRYWTGYAIQREVGCYAPSCFGTSLEHMCPDWYALCARPGYEINLADEEVMLDQPDRSLTITYMRDLQMSQWQTSPAGKESSFCWSMACESWACDSRCDRLVRSVWQNAELQGGMKWDPE